MVTGALSGGGLSGTYWVHEPLVRVPAVTPRELTGTTALKAWEHRRRPGEVFKCWAWELHASVLQKVG